MRALFIIILTSLLINSLNGQIKGNGQIITKEIEVTSIEHLDISLYAKIDIDMNLSNSMTITADANLFEHIDYEVLDGRLDLNQKKWIQPSQDIIIKMGAPALRMVQQGTHETVFVRNIDLEEFNASALVGEIVLSGSCKTLYAGGEVGDIDARQLEVSQVEVNQWGWGKINLASPQSITGMVKGNGKVIYESDQTKVNVKRRDGGRVINLLENEVVKNADARYIRLKVKNNSLKRINAYVRGPKPDGSYFSYGFPMLPGQVRKKNWTVGTKVFRVTGLGIKKLLVQIDDGDEEEVVKLYPKS